MKKKEALIDNCYPEMDMENSFIIKPKENQFYCFRISDIPNAIKIGQTTQFFDRRGKQWRQKAGYKNLEFCGEALPAFVYVQKKDKKGNLVFTKDNKEVFIKLSYTDKQFHKWAMTEKGLKRVERKVFEEKGIYYSEEFFYTTLKEVYDLKSEFDKKIKEDYYSNNKKMRKYYSYPDDTFKENDTIDDPNVEKDILGNIRRNKPFYPRAMQKKAIKALRKMWKEGKDKALTHMSCRSGKTPVALEVIAKSKGNFFVVLSAFSGLASQYMKDAYKYINFRKLIIITPEMLHKDTNIIQKVIKEGYKAVYVDTLSDTQGKIKKDWQAELFNQEVAGLIIDEAHYGARGSSFGYPLTRREEKELDGEIDTEVKKFNAKWRIDMTATPFKLLMTTEYERNNTGVFYGGDYEDLLLEESDWKKKNPDKEEWESPYFGLPRLFTLIVALSPRLSNFMQENSPNSFGLCFSKLFAVENNRFVHEDLVIEFIDSLVKQLKTIEKGKTCYGIQIKLDSLIDHILWVLPSRASIPVMKELLARNDFFKSYTLISVTGKDALITDRVKEEVSLSEKSICFTVDKMLTGATVEKWSTVFLCSDCCSPEKWTQAKFRVTTPCVNEITDESGKVIGKQNLKPQAFFIDFSPERVFKFDYTRLRNTTKGLKKNKIVARIEHSLDICPIFTFKEDSFSKDHYRDMLTVISKNNEKMGVERVISSIPVDLAFKKDSEMMSFLRGQKNPWATSTAFFTEDKKDATTNSNGKIPKQENNPTDNEKKNLSKEDIKELFYSFYRNLLLFTLISKNKNIVSLDDIIDSLSRKLSSEDSTLGRNLDLEEKALRHFSANCSSDCISILNDTIEWYNEQKRSGKSSDIIKNQFRVLDAKSVFTPENITNKIVGFLDEKRLIRDFNQGKYFLDLGTTGGEFAIAITQKLESLGCKNACKQVIAIPATKKAYEVTKFMFEKEGLCVDNISCFTAEDMITTNNHDWQSNIGFSLDKDFSKQSLEEVINYKGDKRMEFGAIVGNPPYQLSDGGFGSSAGAIYPKFVDFARKLDPTFISIITPARWYTCGKGTSDFRSEMLNDTQITKLYDYPNSKDIFKGVDIKGGVCVFLRDNERKVKNNEKAKCEIHTISNDKEIISHRLLKEEGLDIFVRYERLLIAYKKVFSKTINWFSCIVYSRKPYGFATDVITKPSKYGLPEFSDAPEKNGFTLFGLDIQGNRCVRYLSADYPIPVLNEGLYKYKVFLAKANGSPAIGEALNTILIGEPFIGKPGDLCTETFLQIGAFDTEEEALACLKYIKSKFFRCLLGIMKQTQNICVDTFRFVPLQDFTSNSDIDWSKSIHEIDLQLYVKYGLSQEEINFIEKNIKEMA